MSQYLYLYIHKSLRRLRWSICKSQVEKTADLHYVVVMVITIGVVLIRPIITTIITVVVIFCTIENNQNYSIIVIIIIIAIIVITIVVATAMALVLVRVLVLASFQFYQ